MSGDVPYFLETLMNLPSNFKSLILELPFVTQYKTLIGFFYADSEENKGNSDSYTHTHTQSNFRIQYSTVVSSIHPLYLENYL